LNKLLFINFLKTTFRYSLAPGIRARSDSGLSTARSKVRPLHS